MINREEFERYLVNQCHCSRDQGGRDVTLGHTVGRIQLKKSLGNHMKREIPAGEARRFLMDLGFTDPSYTDICREFGIR